MPESLTPITREETYLAAIAGEEVSVPDPICRKEEFLDAIDTHIGGVEGDVTALQTQIPASTAGDSGKVLTAGSTAGTAAWADAPKELPASLGTAGQVLTVNAGATGVEWATPSGGGEGIVFQLSQAAATDLQINISTTMMQLLGSADTSKLGGYTLNDATADDKAALSAVVDAVLDGESASFKFDSGNTFVIVGASSSANGKAFYAFNPLYYYSYAGQAYYIRMTFQFYYVSGDNILGVDAIFEKVYSHSL